MKNHRIETKIETDVALAGKTTLKIGGSADFYLIPESADDVVQGVDWAEKRGLPVFTLGNGSNVLVSDGGWRGLVIDIGERFGRIDWEGDDAVCLSGARLAGLVREMLDRNLAGLETLGGIPGTVGGAIFMNAGAYGHSVSECVVSIDFYDVAEKAVKTIAKKDLKPEYRRTVFSTMPAVILSGRFRFRPDASGKACEIQNECLAQRKRRHPLDMPNCGSVFKNPQASSAGSLIESSGLKGFRIGEVAVSTKHANFIINCGRGSAADARRLIAHLQKTVYAKHGVLLEPEVVFVGDFQDALFIPPCG